MRFVIPLLIVAAIAGAEPAAPELLSLESRAAGASPAQKVGIRQELSALGERLPRTAENLSAQARILAALGDDAGAAALVGASVAEGTRLFERQDYAGALAYANTALAIDPRNQAATGLKRMSEGRAKSASVEPRAAVSAAASGGGRDAADVRPPVLEQRMKKAAVAVPHLTMTPHEGAYVSPGTKRPNPVSALIAGVISGFKKSIYDYNSQGMPKVEQARRILEGTPSGSRLLNDLGGWDEIKRTVQIDVAPLPSERTLALANCRVLPNEHGRCTLNVNLSVATREPEVLAVVLAHELQHIRDYETVQIPEGLAIPSEFAAHRRQSYVYLELLRSLSEQRRSVLAQDDHWQEMGFVADLWKDRILQNYSTIDAFASRHPNMKEMAEAAYSDLTSGAVKPGSDQVDFHLIAPDNGVYTRLSDEKDILDIVSDRRKRRGYSESQREYDQTLLNRREAMIGAMDREDSDYRQANGFVIE